MPFTCGYCPISSSQFKETINHLVTSHSEKEIKMKKLDGTVLRTHNYQIIPNICREQGREITLNEHTGTIHVSKPDKVTKDSPFKKRIKTACGETKETNQSFSENIGPDSIIRIWWNFRHFGRNVAKRDSNFEKKLIKWMNLFNLIVYLVKVNLQWIILHFCCFLTLWGGTA